MRYLPKKLSKRAVSFCVKVRESAGKTPEARHRKILAHAKKQDEFSIQDVVAWMPDVPRRTVERDIAMLVKKRALKTKRGIKSQTV